MTYLHTTYKHNYSVERTGARKQKNKNDPFQADVSCHSPAQRVQDFLLQVSGDRLCTAMFQLAICGGSLAVPQDLVAKEQPAKAAGRPAQHEPAVSLPSEGQSVHSGRIV